MFVSVSTLVPTNTNDYEFQVVLGLSELEVLELFLKNLSFPILINSTSHISSMDTTTGIFQFIDPHLKSFSKCGMKHFHYVLMVYPHSVLT